MEFRVTFSNYWCFKSTSLRLAPLTMIVGPNASGKSALLRALDPQLRISERDVLQQRRGLELRIDVLEGGRKFFQTFREGRNPERSWVTYGYQRVHLDLSQVRAPITLEEQRRLTETGSNLTNVFDTLSREKQGEVVAQFCKLVPVFADVAATPLHTGKKRLKFQDSWNRETWYEAGDVSDGSMLVLAFVLLQHQSPPIDLLAIEEPERGLHPYLLGEVVALLRRMAHGEVGPRPMRVVLATHSPEFLGYASPEEVRFLNRSPQDGSVEITEPPTESPRWQEAFEEYRRSLATAWLSGSLGGVPGS